MNKFVSFFFQYLLLSIFILTSFWTYALQYLSVPRSIKEDQVLSVNFEHRSYYSFNNFNQTGFMKNLEDQGLIFLMDYHLSAFYSPTGWFHIAPYLEAQTHIVNTAIETRALPFFPTLSGLKTWISIHISYFSLFPEIDFSYPLDVQNPISRIITNDGVSSLATSLMGSFNFWRFRPFLRAGYQWRYSISNLLFAQFGILYQEDNLEIGWLTGGFTAVGGDSDRSFNRHKDLEKYNTGSLKFYSTLPASVGTSIWFDAAVNKRMNLLAQINFNWEGFNYAQGYTLHLGVRYHFIKREKGSYKKSIRRFKQKSYDIESLY